MNMTIKDPFDEMEKMQDRMNKLMKSFWERGPELARNIRGFPIDISRENGDMVVKADLPGVDKENVAVKVSEDQLKISTEEAGEKEESTQNFYRRERRKGKTERTITLPEETRSEKAKAKMENGVLEVRIPLKNKEKKKKEKKLEIE